MPIRKPMTKPLTETELVKRTIEFCAEIIKTGVISETQLYGEFALHHLARNPEAVKDHLYDEDNNQH